MKEIYNCIVLEDSLNDQLAIEMVLEQFPEINPTFVNRADDFLREISQTKFSIFIIDIMINDSLTGIDLIQNIDDPEAWVIISSSMDSRDYYGQFKDLKFSKFYIKKPIDEFVFKTNIESFLFSKIEKQEPSIEQFICIKQGNYAYKIATQEINFIETSDHATTIFTKKNKFTTYTPLKTFENQLKNAEFEKINRNTIINVKAINRINVKESYVEVGNQKLAISRNNKQLFIEKYMDK